MWYLVLSHSLPEKEQAKQANYEDHRRWLDDQHRAGRLLFSGPTTTASMVFTSCLRAAWMKPNKSPDRIRIIFGEFEKWKFWNGARIALSG
ncbi:MAG TPA: YciI family protein [Candidatus Binatia bacterium]